MAEGKRDYGNTVAINTRIETELAEKLKEGNPGVSMSKLIQLALKDYASRKRCVICGTMNDGTDTICKNCKNDLFTLETVKAGIVEVAKEGYGLRDPVSPYDFSLDILSILPRLRNQNISITFEPMIKMFKLESGKSLKYMVKLNLKSADGVELSLKEGFSEYVIDNGVLYYYLKTGKLSNDHYEINSVIKERELVEVTEVKKE